MDGFIQEVAMTLDGEILQSKKLDTQLAGAISDGLLPRTAMFIEGDGNGCGDDWCWDSDINAWTLPEVTVTFKRSSLNNEGSYNYINWSSVNNYVGSNSSIGYFGNLDTYYPYSSGSYSVIRNSGFPSEPAHPVGPRPIHEYEDKCSGIQSIWDNYPNNEAAGYMTADGQLLLTNLASFEGGSVASIYTYQGITYYPFPDTQGPPALSYTGVVHSRGYYYIPIVASFQTHSPCRTDGTDGTSQPVSDEDKERALAQPSIRHWAIGCNSVGQYNGTSTYYYNRNFGYLSNICDHVH